MIVKKSEGPGSGKQKLGRKLADLRRQKRDGEDRVTQEMAAKALGINIRKYSNWEQGRVEPDVYECLRLARYYGTTIENLIDGGDAPSILTKTAGCLRWMEIDPEPSPRSDKALRAFDLAARGMSSSQIAQDLKLNVENAAVEVRTSIGDAIHDGLIRLKDVAPDPELSDRLRAAIRENVPAFKSDAAALTVEAMRFGEAPTVFRPEVLGFRASRFLILDWTNHPYNYNIGLVGGYMVSRVVHHVRRGEIANVRVYPWTLHPLRGPVGVNSSNLVSRLASLGGDYKVEGVHFAAPDQEEVVEQLELAAKSDIVFLGIGSLMGEPSERLSNLLDLYKLNAVELRGRGAVGDILGYPIKQDGVLLEVEMISARRWSVPPDALQTLVRRNRPAVAVVAGAEKATAVLGALRGGFVNVLILDDSLATALLGLLNSPQGKSSAKGYH